MDLLVRPASAADGDWLYELHRATMRGSVEALYGPWRDADQRDRFDRRDPAEAVFVVEVDGSPVGTVRRREADDDAIDVALIEVAPEYQGRGLGGSVLPGIIAEAEAANRDVVLQVMKANRAKNLYGRLGFASWSKARRRPTSRCVDRLPDSARRAVRRG